MRIGFCQRISILRTDPVDVMVWVRSPQRLGALNGCPEWPIPMMLLLLPFPIDQAFPIFQGHPQHQEAPVRPQG